MKYYNFDISPIDTKYRYYTVTGECQFKDFQVLCVEENINERCESITIFSGNLLDLDVSGIISNETSSLYRIAFRRLLGSQVVVINNLNVFNIECLDIDFNLISFSRVNQFFSRPIKNLYTSFMGIIKMQGIQVYQNTTFNFNPSFVDSLEGCTFTLSLFNNYFLIECSNTMNPSFYLDRNITMSITYSQSNIVAYNLGSIIQDKLYIDDVAFDSYPKIGDLLSYQLSGFYECPVFTFASNHSISKVYPYLISVDGTSTKNIIRPVYGDEKTTTYLFPLNSYAYPSYTSYGFGYIKNNQKGFISFSTSYSQYTIASPQINDSIQTQLLVNGLPILNVGYSNRNKYGLVSFKINYGYNLISKSPVYKSFPYGFSSGSNNQYVYNVSALVLPFTFVAASQNIIEIESLDSSSINIVYDNFETPTIPKQSQAILDYSTIHLVADLYLYQVKVNLVNGYLFLKLSETNIFGPEVRISGNSTIGIYQFTLPVLYTDQFLFFDRFGKSSIFIENPVKYLSLNPIQTLQSPIQNKFDIYSIKNVSFLYNGLNVTNHRHYNKLYFSYDNIQSSTINVKMVPIGVDTVQDIISSNDEFNNHYFYSKFNNDSGGFEIEFYVDANTMYGPYPFYLDFGNNNKLYSEFLNTTLYINYTKFDNQGPQFKYVSKSNLSFTLSATNRVGVIGWSFTIEDQINGFKNGYIVVRGDLDSSCYNFTISLDQVKAGGNRYLGDYDIKLNLTWPCVSQSYVITQVVLYDQMERVSYFSISPSIDQSSSEFNAETLQIAMLNPFLNSTMISTINTIQVTCANDPDLVASEDDSGPVLVSFKSSTNSIDVGQIASKRNVTFTFSVSDFESGIKNTQYPIVYLTTIYNRILECKSTIVEYNTTSAKYSCSIAIPKGFSYPFGILLSVYGFINNNGLFSGYSTNQLIEKQFDYYINTTFTTNQPNIDRHFRISEKGGDLWLLGSGFGLDSTAYIKYNDNTVNVIKASKVYSTALLIQGIKPTSKPFEIYIKSESINSFSFIVTPTVFDYYINGDDTSITPLPPPSTNKPQLCSGDPVCGGPSNGYCNQDTGCVCYSPWVLDCLSQIVIVDPPSINETNPSTEIIIPGSKSSSSSSSNGEPPSFNFNSLISMVSLREFNIMGEVIYSKSFDKWILNKYDESTFIYNTILSISKDSGKNGNVSVTVTLRWFIHETNITFADEQFTINPSTIKYTIEIGSYPFDSNLNQLEIVMSAYMESSKNGDDICSVKEFDETSNGDNSNYLKIQVDNHSLYGRFIRRGIIDSRTTLIKNVLLDKDMNPITKSNALQSYIGIQVPNYQNSIILDPDFSIIIDPYSASSKSNSVCSNKKSKLSSAKIAGIIIAGVAFFASIVTIIVYHYIKKKKNSKFIANVAQKMKQLNN